MNNRITAALAVAGSLLLGPAALAAPVEPAPMAGGDLELVRDDILDHGQDDHGRDDQGRDDHDHDGDGRPDHDPEDHEDSEDEPKPKDDED